MHKAGFMSPSRRVPGKIIHLSLSRLFLVECSGKRTVPPDRESEMTSTGILMLFDPMSKQVDLCKVISVREYPHWLQI